MELVRTTFRVEDGVGFIGMDSPETLNAFDNVMNPELLYLLGRCAEDRSVRVVVLQGLKRVFSAGGNLKVFYADFQANGRVDLPELLEQAGRITSLMRRMDKLVITSVSGAAAGAGANLALSGDFVLASEDARFLQAFVNVGLAPDTGGVFQLCRAVGSHRAMELCVSGRPLGAAEARDLGLVNEIWPVEKLEAQTVELAKRLARGPIRAYAGIKRMLHAAAFFDYDAFLNDVELPQQDACMKTKDFEEALCRFVEKR